MYGAYDTIENRPALRFERRLSHPVEVVWRAITESDELERWFPSRAEAGDRESWRSLYEEYQRRGTPAGAPIPGE